MRVLASSLNVPDCLSPPMSKLSFNFSFGRIAVHISSTAIAVMSKEGVSTVGEDVQISLR